ncbi:MAG: class I SAM-dependent methyltransferase [Methanofollis sp.]|uniref:class I SAM-dependent methyltransferase n=1 Tax=Methanofollis sp. TaxID=2052835 RepID=UPI002608016E|nr:class I SAM-dependent methyltransferase [Methanofollis sp.]MDD4254481.1 class I SAM-dependent methyltransferase [Methanofollis sp.]
MTSELVDHLTRVQKFEETDFRLQNLRRMIQQKIKGKKVLDAGCGTGHMTLDLLHRGYDVTAIDCSPDLIHLVERSAKNHGYNVKTSQLNVEDCSRFGENTFDTIVCLDVLEHIKDDKKALRSLHLILHDSGRLIVSVPSLKSLYGERDLKIGHYRRYSRDELITKIQDAGFQIEEIRYWNILGVLPFFISEKLLHTAIYEGIRYSRDSILSKGSNSLLNMWFRTVENNIKLPLGLSLIVSCKKQSE